MTTIHIKRDWGHLWIDVPDIIRGDRCDGPAIDNADLTDLDVEDSEKFLAIFNEDVRREMLRALLKWQAMSVTGELSDVKI